MQCIPTVLQILVLLQWPISTKLVVCTCGCFLQPAALAAVLVHWQGLYKRSLLATAKACRSLQDMVPAALPVGCKHVYACAMCTLSSRGLFQRHALKSTQSLITWNPDLSRRLVITPEYVVQCMGSTVVYSSILPVCDRHCWSCM